MSVISADEVQIAIVEEVTYGVTPATPVFEVVPLTGEGIVAEVSSQNSNMMTEDRQVLDLITTSIAASGDINTELAITPGMKILLASAMAEAWVILAPAITGLPPAYESMIGKTQLSYTVEKRFPDPANVGEYIYHRISGCVSNTANMTVSPEEAATISFGIIGKEFVTSDIVKDAVNGGMVAGATYVIPSNPTVLRGPDTITIDILGHSVAVNCFGEFSWDINNNYRGILCLGHLGNKDVAIGRAEINMAMRVYFSSNTLLDALLDQTETAVTFEMQNTDDPGEYFASHFPRVKLSQDNVVAGGTGEDVVDDITATALFNSVGTLDVLGLNNADKTSLRVVLGSGAITV